MFDLVITTYEELEICTEESVWESDYVGKMAKIEGYYSRMVAVISGVAVEYEEVCAEQEKQKKVEQAAVAAAAGGGAGAVGGGAAVSGIKYRAEMALCPEKLAVDSTGLEYRAFLQKWNSYYLASNFGRALPETQIAYLTNCLSADLLAKLHFGDCATIEQAVNVIDVDYKARNPLTVTRLLFSRCKQGKSEAFTDYVIQLEAAHKEADMSSMGPEDIMALQMWEAVMTQSF